MDENRFYIKRPDHLTRWLKDHANGWVQEQVDEHFECENSDDLPEEYMQQVLDEWSNQEIIFHLRIINEKPSDDYFSAALLNIIRRWEIKNDTMIREI